MKRIIKQTLKKILLEKITERDYNFEVQKRDKFIISYPRSGNTWMRFLLANILTNKKVDFINIENIIVALGKRSDRQIRNSKEHFNIFKSHSFFRPKFSNNKVLYIVRDVRDVVISYYNYFKKKGYSDFGFDQFLNLFIDGNVDKYGKWGEHVGSWMGAKQYDKENFLLVRYEDMVTIRLRN